MNINVQTAGGASRLSLQGRFDFNCHRDFRSACNNLLDAPGAEPIEIDFGQVEYLDSSALGMLLQVRERAQAKNRQVKLTNCSGIVGDVLKVANFGKLFVIA